MPFGLPISPTSSSTTAPSAPASKECEAAPTTPTKSRVAFTAISRSLPEYSPSNHFPSSGENTPTSCGTPDTASSTTSLDFGFDDDELIPNCYLELQPSETNGTTFTPTLAQLKSPSQSTNDLTRGFTRRVRSPDWHSMKNGFGKLKEETSASCMEYLNQAFQGLDIPEISNAVVARIPTVRVPSGHECNKVIDIVVDAAQHAAVFESMPRIIHLSRKFTQGPWMESPSRTPISNSLSGLQDSRLYFARLMGQKARDALVEEQICQRFHTWPGCGSDDWQGDLDKSLVLFYDGAVKEYTLDDLLNMTPVWIGDCERRVWKLVLDVGIIGIETRVGSVIDADEQVLTGFEIPEQKEWMSIYDYNRTMTMTVEGGEWENFDR